MSKKILFVRTHSFPDVGPGTLRVESFCRYLQENGFEVTLLALDPLQPGARGQRYGNGRGSFEIISFPNPWAPASFRGRLEFRLAASLVPEMEYAHCMNRLIVREGDGLLKRRCFDGLIASYPPMGSLRAADTLSRKHGIPWLADLRDIPDEIDWERKQRITRRSVRVLSQTCLSASHILTVSEPLKQRLQSQYGIKAPVTVVHNGFEENDLAGLETPESSPCFRITYCGHIGYGRDPSLVLDAVDLLLDRDVDMRGFEIHFFGDCIRTAINPEQRKCREMVHFHDRVSHHEALAAQTQAALLLSLSSPSAKGVLTSKVFEYAMTGRPVLSIPPDNADLDNFIRRARIGVVAGSSEEAARFILTHLQAWRATGELPRTDPDISYLAQFTRRNQAARVAEVLRSVLPLAIQRK